MSVSLAWDSFLWWLGILGDLFWIRGGGNLRYQLNPKANIKGGMDKEYLVSSKDLISNCEWIINPQMNK